MQHLGVSEQRASRLAVLSRSGLRYQPRPCDAESPIHSAGRAVCALRVFAAARSAQERPAGREPQGTSWVYTALMLTCLH